MSAPFIQFDKAIIGATAAAATLIMGSCGSSRGSSPRQADAGHASLSYRYGYDATWLPAAAVATGEAIRTAGAVEHYGRSGGASPPPIATSTEAD